MDSTEPCNFAEDTLELLTVAPAMMGAMGRRAIAAEDKERAVAEARAQAQALIKNA
jgi:hypothetical protein